MWTSEFGKEIDKRAESFTHAGSMDKETPGSAT